VLETRLDQWPTDAEQAVVLVSVLNAPDALYAAAAHPLVATAPKAVSVVAYGASFTAEDAAHFQRVGVDACLVRRPPSMSVAVCSSAG
jgi:hypothetical protein